MNNLKIYNTQSKKKETFTPVNNGKVGMYVCGPTVYGNAHLGHARPGITFDIVYRYLLHLGYKVRYVRNITDVGHLVNDLDEGEDKIIKKAKIDNLEPMEVVANCTRSYHTDMKKLNNLDPSIEPTATGHIIEQIELIKDIISKGYAYESNGDVYFDVSKYNERYNYGKLSGRNIEDLISNTRILDGQSSKKKNEDFALWKKAKKNHIMSWPSPWSKGFPGWHIECSAMSLKYLGSSFDIHGGGMDLIFPHHEAEIAQSSISTGQDPVKYWMHNNMITINGQKMGKSLGNFITLDEFFTGQHEKLSKSFSPTTIRFFILQAHYRSPLDFSNMALESSEKGLQKLLRSINTLEKIKPSKKNSVNTNSYKKLFYEAINDDFNTPILISYIFDVVKLINNIKTNKVFIDKKNKNELILLMKTFCFDILGLKNNKVSTSKNEDFSKLIKILIQIRATAKEDKNYTLADSIRSKLERLNIVINDNKEGTNWDFDT
tara:strand:+ start:505 stop:1974 length:1470 start_codon:yes stop_codon:yes gene_type:complete